MGEIMTVKRNKAYLLGDFGPIYFSTHIPNPVSNCINMVCRHTVQKQIKNSHIDQDKSLNTYPISSRMVGIAHQARCAFLLLLMEVESRKALYIFEIPLPDIGVLTVLPNIRWT
jgi:hypothetical protein